MRRRARCDEPAEWFGPWTAPRCEADATRRAAYGAQPALTAGTSVARPWTRALPRGAPRSNDVRPSVQFMQVAGVPVRLHWSFLLAVPLIAAATASRFIGPAWTAREHGVP